MNAHLTWRLTNIKMVTAADFDPTLVHPIDFGSTFLEEFKHFPLEKKQPIFSKNDFRIARIFYPFVRILQIFGLIQVSARKRGHEIRYDYNIISFVCLYCWVVASFVGCMFFVFIANRELGINWPFQMFKNAAGNQGPFKEFQSEGEAPQLVTMNRVFQVLLPMASLLISISARLRFHHLKEFLNNWTQFLKEFHSKFSTFYIMELEDLERKGKRMLIICCLITCNVLITATNKSMQGMLVNRNLFFNTLTLLVGWLFIGVAWFYDTSIIVLSLQTIKEMTRQLRHGIETQYKVIPHAVTYDDVKSWMRFLNLIRDQTLTFQKYASLPELADLLMTFILVLSLALVLFNTVLDGRSTGQNAVIPFAAMTVLLGFVRVYIKAIQAEKTAEEEEKIANYVIGMSTNDCKTRLEMKIFVDLIMTNPIQVTYGNVVVLNRRLVLSLISQLAAYLVVMIQFKASTG